MDDPTPQRSSSDHGRRHGRPRSWFYVGVFLLFFAAGGVALVVNAPALFWVCLAALILLVPIGKMIGVMDDTMTSPADPEQRPHG